MIGKTRQSQPSPQPIQLPSEVVVAHDPAVGPPRGILWRPLAAGKLHHSRRAPAPELVPFVAHYWIIHWDLRNCPPHIAESLPHPNIHLAFEETGEETGAVIHGVRTRKFSVTLTGQSQVFGIKFRSGGFRPFYGGPISQLADRQIPASEVFGAEVDSLRTALLSSIPEDKKVAAANAFLLARLPAPHPSAALAAQLVEQILNTPAIQTVDDLARHAAIGKRSLQRLFSEYIGASPKWVIRRYRLHELIERSNAGEQLDWIQVALDLGYFDQAHLINDFKSIVGFSPTQYQRLISPTAADTGL